MCKIIETVARVNFLKVETQQSSGGAETIREMEEWSVYRKWRNFVKLWTRFIKSWGSLMERIQGLVLLLGGGGKGAPGGGCSYCKNSVFLAILFIESKVWCKIGEGVYSTCTVGHHDKTSKKDQKFINCNKSYFVKMFILAKEGYRVLCPLFPRRKGMLKKLIKITKGILYLYITCIRMLMSPYLEKYFSHSID